MKGDDMTQTDQRWRALSLYTVGFTLLLAILACGGATADSVRILDVPQFICPTSTPQPTHTQAPTQVQPDIQVPPSGYATHTPVFGCIWNGVFCVTNTPLPGGIYTTPAYRLPGPTSTPRPTLTPWPSPTPYIITGGFHLGADVYIGGSDSAVSVRLRIDDVTTHHVDTTRQVVAWTVEIENTGAAPYFTIPGGQVFVASVHGVENLREGQWWASQEAAAAAGITLQSDTLDVLEVAPGDDYRLTLTAFTPVGEPGRFGWILDPVSGGRDGDMTGGNVAYWVTDTNPDCAGNMAPGATLPTPVAPPATPTPSPTPVYPSWCTWCGEG